MKAIGYTIGIIFACLVTGMILNAPIEKWQKAYIKFVMNYRNAPQKRIDDTYKYVENLENGEIDYQIEENTFSKKAQLNKMPPQTNHTRQNNNEKYVKPLYIRDKNNPRILHKNNK